MNEKKKALVNGYLLVFESEGVVTVLKIRRDHHAEQILRGLVHSGYVVTIRETQIEVEAVSDDEKRSYGECAAEAPTARF